MKWAAISTLILLAFVSQTFAVLRPPFPAKPAAPFDGDLIIIGDDLMLESPKTLAASPELGCVANAWEKRYGLWPEGCPSVGDAFAKISHAREKRFFCPASVPKSIPTVRL
jgi:hypothetical protein